MENIANRGYDQETASQVIINQIGINIGLVLIFDDNNISDDEFENIAKKKLSKELLELYYTFRKRFGTPKSSLRQITYIEKIGKLPNKYKEIAIYYIIEGKDPKYSYVQAESQIKIDEILNNGDKSLVDRYNENKEGKIPSDILLDLQLNLYFAQLDEFTKHRILRRKTEGGSLAIALIHTGLYQRFLVFSGRKIED